MQALTVHWKRQMQHMSVPVQHRSDHTASFMLHLEVTLSTKAQCSKASAFCPPCLSVTMVTDAIVTILVNIHQYRVKVSA